MNGGSRYPFLEAIAKALMMVLLVGLIVGALYLLVAIFRFFLPKITTLGLIIMIPLTIFVLFWGIGIITDIIRLVKDHKARVKNDDTDYRN